MSEIILCIYYLGLLHVFIICLVFNYLTEFITFYLFFYPILYSIIYYILILHFLLCIYYILSFTTF